MDEPTTDADTPAPAEDLTLVALTPADMVPAQTELRAWCDRKVAAVQTELADLEANLEMAVTAGFKLRGVQDAISRTNKRVLYYEKLKAAVEAGYVIVPNFPVALFAVRVQRDKQREATDDYSRSSKFEAKPELLPAGEGRYVDERVFTTSEQYEEKGYNDKMVTKTRYTSADYDVVDFPVSVVKPSILAATQQAMALKLFDQMGIVRNESGNDPIVVGQLLDPRGNGRRVTFFVAWWLDTASL